MKLSPDLFLKWIEAGACKDNTDLVLTGLCTLYSRSATEDIDGFTIFEPRSLDKDFFARLERRQASDDFTGRSFFLILPAFLRHRLETLTAGGKWKNLDIQYSSFAKIRKWGGRLSIRSKMKVITVDDSPVLLKLLRHCLDELGYIDVVAQVSDPLTAVDKIRNLKPDAVTMDIQMPGRTGVDVVKDLLADHYFPILMISSLNLEEGSLVFDALNAGAVDYLQKPKLEEKETFKEELNDKLLMAVKIQEKGSCRRNPLQPVKKHRTPSSGERLSSNLIWCLGASTGGTQALTEVFTALPGEIPPTLVVQHIPPVFSKAFAKSLNELCPFTVKEAEDGEVIAANHVYIAPGGLQMGVLENQHHLEIRLQDVSPVNRFKPSVDFLFEEVARLKQVQVVAGLLTGMGRDGAQGLMSLRKSGAKTFAQDEKSSIVYGMPRAAAELGAAEEIVPLHKMAQILMERSFGFLQAG